MLHAFAGMVDWSWSAVPGPRRLVPLDLAALRASLAARGIEVAEPHDLEWRSIGVVADPDGNTIWLLQSKPR